MVYQFEAEKCFYAASTDNLVLMIIDNIVQRLKGGDYHLSGEFMGPTSSSSLFGVDFESGC